MLTWSREYELPNERKPGPRETISIPSLSAAGIAAVTIIDGEARRSAETALAHAETVKADWDKGE
jgi:hypothetical protein